MNEEHEPSHLERVTHLAAGDLTPPAFAFSKIPAETLIEKLPFGIIATDKYGRIVLVNERAEIIFGYTREELIGQTVEMLMPESIRPKHTMNRERYIAQPNARRMGGGLVGKSKDGQEIKLDIFLGTPFVTPSGLVTVAAILLTNEDA